MISHIKLISGSGHKAGEGGVGTGKRQLLPKKGA